MTPDERKERLDIYKIAIEMADKHSTRRLQINSFYAVFIGVIFTGIFKFLDKVSYNRNFAIVGCVVGIIFCIIWFLQLRYFKHLNSIKFAIIQDIEKNMSIKIFTDEWSRFKQKNTSISTTQLEYAIPIILAIIFLLTFLSTIKFC